MYKFSGKVGDNVIAYDCPTLVFGSVSEITPEGFIRVKAAGTNKIYSSYRVYSDTKSGRGLLADEMYDDAGLLVSKADELLKKRSLG